MYGKLAFAYLVALVACAPQRGGGGKAKGAKAQTAAAQVAQLPQGLSKATDGSTILDNTVEVNGLPIRFKIAAPADKFLADTGVPGAAATDAAGTMGTSFSFPQCRTQVY
jgi:hypothetical protein